MKSLPESIIESANNRMSECKKRKDEKGFYEAKGLVEKTLRAIDNVDQNCFDKYRHLLDEEF